MHRRSPHSRLRRRRGAWAAYAALAVADTALAGSARPAARRARVATKPLLMPALARAYAVDTAGRDDHLRRALLAAHALSGLGDVALLRRSHRALLVGLGGFFAAHLAYVSAFVPRGLPVSDPRRRGGAVAAGLAFAAAGPLMGWAAGRRSPELRGPVVAYAALLAGMVASSTRLGDDVPPRARRTIVSGTMLFLASDATLGTRRFLLTDPGPAGEAVVMATYTAAQGLIARGAVAVPPAW